MLTRTTTRHGLILLYHFVSKDIPTGFGKTLHGTTPRMLEKNLADLQAAWRFVSLEEFAGSEDRSGLAAITFDDGYKCIIEEALPVLEEYGAPVTLFLNPVALSGKWNWRDKVRYLIRNGLEQDFLDFFPVAGPRGNLYRDSKHPENNSASIDHALDNFLGDLEPDAYGGFPYARISDLPIDHPLVTYGNHGFNHYVMASLSSQQQEHEISLADSVLRKSGLPVANGVFSVPFGGDGDINEETVRIAGKQGYPHLLMSRQRLNQPTRAPANPGFLERFMPRSNDIHDEINRIVSGS